MNKGDRQIRIIRPMPESLLDAFKCKLSAIDFNDKFRELPVDMMVDSFENITQSLIDETFPSKKICIYVSDQPWFNEELRTLKRQRLREYEKHGKSQKYTDLLETFSQKTKEDNGYFQNRSSLFRSFIKCFELEQEFKIP